MPTKYEGSELEKRALNTFLALIRASESSISRISSTIAESGLTYSQWAVLDAIYWCGVLKGREIAARLFKSHGNITHVLDNLQKNGLIKRTRSRNDRRELRVGLTEAGTQKYLDHLPTVVSKLKNMASVLTPEEQKQLRHIASKLGRSLE